MLTFLQNSTLKDLNYPFKLGVIRVLGMSTSQIFDSFRAANLSVQQLETAIFDGNRPAAEHELKCCSSETICCLTLPTLSSERCCLTSLAIISYLLKVEASELTGFHAMHSSWDAIWYKLSPLRRQHGGRLARCAICSSLDPKLKVNKSKTTQLW